MTIDAHVLQETWSILKQYVPQKDRQEAVDNLTSFYVDCLTDHDLEEFAKTDSYTERAAQEYIGDLEDEEYDTIDETDDEW